MLNKARHKTLLITILKEIYADPKLRTILGFKGGTAAFLFYDLPRFSVDLDFDLLDESKKEIAFKKVSEILKQNGNLSEAIEKRFTLFFLLNYQRGERNLKIEISKRATGAEFEVKQYLGIPVLVMEQSCMVAGKLSALLTRTHFASRDLFDLWFFLQKGWAINERILLEKSGVPTREALRQAIDKVGKLPRNQLLQGSGELLDKKQKVWVKEKLKEELLFQLKLYLETRAEK